MDRRTLLLAAGAGGLLAGCGGSSDSSGISVAMNPGPAAGPGAATIPQGTTPALAEGQPLRALARLVNTSTAPGVFEASLTAAPVDLELVPGVRTTFWAYNGSVPGPLIEATEGDRVRLTFVNAADAGVDRALARHAGAGRAGRQPDGSGRTRAPRGCTSSRCRQTAPPRTGTTRTRTESRTNRYIGASRVSSSSSRVSIHFLRASSIHRS